MGRRKWGNQKPVARETAVAAQPTEECVPSRSGGFEQMCPSCEAMAPVKDSGLIGKKIDCPKCKYRFVVEEPAEMADAEVEEAPAKKKKAKKKKKGKGKGGAADKVTTKPTDEATLGKGGAKHILFDESMGITCVTLALCALCWYGVYWSASGVVRQHRVFTAMRPVEARVVSAGSGKPLMYRPTDRTNVLNRIINGPPHEVWVSYRYTVGGAEHVSGEAAPREGEKGLDAARRRWPGTWSGQVILPNESGVRCPDGSESWARGEASRYVPGRTCQAYYDPDAPSRCCLLKDLDFTPYAVLLISLPGACFFGMNSVLVIVIVGRLIAAASGRLGRPRSGTDSWDAWERVWVGSWVAVFLIGCCAALGHYFIYTPRPFELSLAPLLVPVALAFLFAVFVFAMLADARDSVAGRGAAPTGSTPSVRPTADPQHRQGMCRMGWYSHKLLAAVLMMVCGAFGVVLNLALQGRNWLLMAACAGVVFFAGTFALFVHYKDRRGK